MIATNADWGYDGLLSENKQGMSNGLTLTAERDLWKEIALVKESSLLLVNSWCATEWCGSQQADCSAGNGEILACGAAHLQWEEGPDLDIGSGVLWELNMGRGTDFWIPLPVWQKCPVAPRFAKKSGSESGYTKLLEKRNLSDPASVSWACCPELTSYLESVFPWLPLVCGFFALCCFSKCPSSLTWTWDMSVPQLQPESFAICVPHS